MSEWKQEIRERLALLNLAPTREAEIVEELSQHLEDRYAEMLSGGATEDETFDRGFIVRLTDMVANIMWQTRFEDMAYGMFLVDRRKFYEMDVRSDYFEVEIGDAPQQAGSDQERTMAGEPTMSAFGLNEETAYFRCLVALCEPTLRNPQSPWIPTSTQIAERLVRKSLNDEDHQRLVREALARIGSA